MVRNVIWDPVFKGLIMLRVLYNVPSLKTGARGANKTVNWCSGGRQPTALIVFPSQLVSAHCGRRWGQALNVTSFKPGSH